MADRLARTRGWAKGSPEDTRAHEMYASGGQFMEQFADEFNFAVADVDGDGAWTLDEYRLYLQTLNAPTDRAADVFRQTDVHGTGRISKAMLTQVLNEYFLSDDPAAVGNLLLGAY